MVYDTSIPTRTLVLGCIRRDGSLDAAELYSVAEACGMTDLQVRLCLRRLISEGLLEHVRGRGRRAEFKAQAGSADRILPELEYLQFARRQDAGMEPWDGHWHVVGFSVSEHHRTARDTFRDYLRHYGGAYLNGGLYVSPHGWDELVVAEAQRLGIADTLTLIECERLSVGGATEPRDIAMRLWPLESVAAGYEEFIRRFEKWLERASALEKPPSLDLIVGRVFAVMLEFGRAMEPDPLLPGELLPEHWPGPTARRCLVDAQQFLAPFGVENRFPAIFDRLATVEIGNG
jgi:phenylacetic acid degradation operon negative regulatory protein